MFEPPELKSIRRQRLAIIGAVLFAASALAVGSVLAWKYLDRQDPDFYSWGVDPNYEPKLVLFRGGTCLAVVAVIVLLSSVWRSRQ